MKTGDPTESDVELLEQWSSGSKDAGDTLVRRHFQTIYRFFSRRTLDADASRDLTQKTFLACLEKPQRWRRETSFRVYLLGVARNMLLFETRTKGRETARLERLADHATASVTSPSSAAARREYRFLLLEGLRSLPGELQVTVELHYWEELNSAQIANVLGLAAGTVRWRLARARSLLKRHILRHDAPLALRTSALQDLADWARTRQKSPPDA